MVQVPGFKKVALFPETVQTDEVAGAAAKLTGSAELAVALNVSGVP
jgi:hypothetical protein